MNIKRTGQKIVRPFASKRFYFVLLAIAGLVVAGDIAYQLSYPGDRALPNAKVNGRDVGGMNRSQLIDFMRQQYDQAPLVVKAGEATVETTIAKAGLIPDYIGTSEQVYSYDLKQRAIPFHMSFKGANTDIQPKVIADEERLDSFATELQKLCYAAPANASVRISEGQPVLESAKAGRTCEPDTTKQTLKALQLQKQNAVTVPDKPVLPQRSDEDVRPLFNKAASITSHTFYLSIINDRQPVPKDMVASWIEFTEDADGKIGLGINQAKVAKYLKSREKTVYIAPGTMVITLVDGTEVSRTGAFSGQGIDITATSARVQDVLLGDTKEDTAYAALTVIPPKVQYARSYSKSQQGLDTLLTDLAKEKGNYGIAVRVINGRYEGLASSANGDRSYVTASTYKLFVAYSVLKENEKGALPWNEIISDSRNAEQCFEDMIVKSDNPCARAFAKRVGDWQVIENQMHSLGLRNTYLAKSPTYDNFSTAKDEALFMALLETGESLQGESRRRLLDAMKRQIYRSGIPSGTGVPVADKVGFLYGLLHDASIVYSPNGTYALVILTDNSSWSNIADTARRINQFLAQ